MFGNTDIEEKIIMSAKTLNDVYVITPEKVLIFDKVKVIRFDDIYNSDDEMLKELVKTDIEFKNSLINTFIYGFKIALFKLKGRGKRIF